MTASSPAITEEAGGEWSPLVRTTVSWADCGIDARYFSSQDERLALVRHHLTIQSMGGEFWKNDRYLVTAIRGYQQLPSGVAVTWIAIRRSDRRAASHKNWRDFQRIKNEIAGPDCEAAEIYPAQSHVVDNENAYHLWALENPSNRFSFGWNVDGGAAVPRGENKW